MINSVSNAKFRMCKRRFFQSQASEIHFQTELGYFIEFDLGLCQAWESEKKKSALK